MDELKFLKTDLFDIFKNDKYRGQNIEALIKGKNKTYFKLTNSKGISNSNYVKNFFFLNRMTI